MASPPARLLAGSRTESGYVDDIGPDARFEWPACLVADDDYLYVTEWIGQRVRRIDPGTGEVTTALTLPSGVQPYGIARHPGSGNFYVACTSDQTIRVYDPSWSLLAIITDPTRYIWYCSPSDDESTVYATGNFNPDFVFESRVMQYDGAGSLIFDAYIDAAVGHGAFVTPGGILQVGSDVFWAAGRFGNRGLYKADDPDLSSATITRDMDWSTFPGSSEDLGWNSPRALHAHPGDPALLTLAFGPAGLNSDDLGEGARDLRLSPHGFSNPAPLGHAAQAGNNCMEVDYLFAFGRRFVVSSAIVQSNGFGQYENFSGPHSIEVLMSGGWMIDRIGFS